VGRCGNLLWKKSRARGRSGVKKPGVKLGPAVAIDL
jgi:hypothetical protein